MAETLVEIVDKITTPVIVAGFVIMAYLIVKLSGKLNTLKQEAAEQLLQVKGGAQINPKTLALRQRNTAIASRETSYKLRDTFNECCSHYATVSHLIPLFPLLGILGTVAGLYRQVSTMDAAMIYDALDTALSTTLWGLLAAVILKFAEALFVMKRINEIDAVFESYDIRYQDATLQKDFAEETAE